MGIVSKVGSLTEWVFGYKDAFGYDYAYLTHTCDDMLPPPKTSFLSLLGDLFWEKGI
jgi:hypothetical protein